MAHHESKDFLVGAAIGGLLGSVSALLMAPKTGKELREDINDIYCDVAEKTQEVSKKGKEVINNFRSAKHHSLTDKAKELVSDVVGWVRDEEEDKEGMSSLVVGSIVGGIVGVVAGLLLAPKAGSKLRDDISDTYSDLSKKSHKMIKNAKSKTHSWIDTVTDIVESFTDKAKETGDELGDKAEDLLNNNKVKQILEWVSIGSQLWKHTKGRR